MTRRILGPFLASSALLHAEVIPVPQFVPPPVIVPQNQSAPPNYDFRQFMNSNEATLEAHRSAAVRKIIDGESAPTVEEMQKINKLFEEKKSPGK